MKVVHINKERIRNEKERSTLCASLLAKWDEQARRRAEKLFAKVQKKRDVQ